MENLTQQDTSLKNNDFNSYNNPENYKGSRTPIYKKWWFWLIVAAAAVVLISVIFTVTKSKSDWPKSGLAALVPTPDSSQIEVVINDDEQLTAHVESFSKEKYDTYIEECTEAGFKVDAKNESHSFEAYDEKGNKLELTFFDSKNEMTISIDAAMKFEEIEWPTIGIGKLLPVPKSTTGKITSDSESSFIAYINNTTPEDFKEYVKKCQDAGFTVNYDKGDDYYYADNKDGYHLSLNYKGNKTMFVRIENYKDDAETTGQTTKKESPVTKKESPSEKSADKVSPEFKEMMDSYESFINDYVEFMKKYNKSKDTSAMLDDYLDYMNKYNDFAKKVSDVKQDELSEADAAYYVKVNERVIKKLAEIN